MSLNVGTSPRRRRLRTTLALAIAVLALLTWQALPPSITRAHAAAAGSPAVFVPTAVHLASTQLATTSWSTITVAGVGGLPTTGLASAVINVSVTSATATSGTVQVAAVESATPIDALSIGGLSKENTAMIALSSAGTFVVRAPASTTLSLDLQGYYTTSTSGGPSGFTPSTAKVTQMLGSVNLAKNVTAPNVPRGATAIFANVVAQCAFATAPEALQFYPTGGTPPAKSSLVPCGAAGVAFGLTIDVNDTTEQFSDRYFMTMGNEAAGIRLSITVEGYFTPTAADGAFYTTGKQLTSQTVPAGSQVVVPALGVGGVPANNVRALALSVAVANNGTAGSVRVGQDDLPLPADPVVMWSFAGSTSGYSIVTPGSDGGIAVLNTSSAAVTVTVTTDGYFSGSPLPLTVDSAGWIHYNNVEAFRLPLTSLTALTESGTVGSDGSCSFAVTQSDSSQDGETGVYKEVTAYNPTSCQRQVVRGLLNDTARAQATSVDATASAATLSPVPPAPNFLASGDNPPAGSNGSWFVHEKVAYIDPLFITITSLTDDLYFLPVQGKIIWGKGYVAPYEFKYDGWSNSGTPNRALYLEPSAASYVQMNEAESFVNTDFEQVMIAVFGPAAIAACGFDTSPAVFYLNPVLYGYGNLNYSFNHNESARGGCSDLVHFSENHGYGWTA